MEGVPLSGIEIVFQPESGRPYLGETVSAKQGAQVIDHGTRLPATGVMAFHWSGLSRQWDKVDALDQAYRSIQPTL